MAREVLEKAESRMPPDQLTYRKRVQGKPRPARV